MKTTFRSLSYLLIFVAAVALLLGAAAPEMPTAGKFLVLRNGQTMEGDIERVDGQYRVRRNGAETWVSANLVLRLFLDTEDAYKFLRGKSNLEDADDRLRLAKWCLDFNLRDHAKEEVSVALVLRPDDMEAKRLRERLQEPPAPAAMKSAPMPASPQPELPASPVELTPEAFGQFMQKVQPILVNACASCHANGRGGSFKLLKTVSTPTLNRKITQDNLTAVFGQINYVQPQLSPLLAKAVSIHGGSVQAPLSGRQAIASHTLEDWIKTTLATNPHLSEHLGIAAVAPPPPAPASPETKSAFADGKADVPAHAVELPRLNVVPITPAPLVPPPATPLAKPATGGAEVCDPAEFNRQAHPERDK